MSKIDKKKIKLQEQITELETEMRLNLTKKTSNTKEISIGEYQRKIMDLKTKLSKL